MKYRRCLVPGDGFYDWKASGTRRQPYYARAKSGQPLAFAGLWETWTGPNGEELETAAIVTTRANRTLAGIHERMPVIITPDAFDLWLNCGAVDPETAATLIAPAPEDLLEAYEVSSAVNRTANDHPQLVEPNSATEPEPVPKRASVAGRRSARARKDDGQGVLF
jgi:putative SOS response-associated peptidase YedK